MAESKKRKKNGHEVEDDTEIQNWTDGIPLSPAWWAPTFVALMILGVIVAGQGLKALRVKRASPAA